MSRLSLVLPGLIWPAPQTQHPARGVPTPALARLLGFGRRHIQPPLSHEQQLLRIFGMETGIDGENLPLAALRRLGEENTGEAENTAGESHWLCADPVNLSFMGQHLLLDEFAEEEIATHEATAIIATLNDEFTALGHFSMATPTRWYLRLKQPASTRFAPLSEVVCRPVQHFLPTGEGDARHWRRVLNEVQVALHNHPVNAAREASGRRPINSLWFWGSAPSAPGSAYSPESAIQALDPVACGLARRVGIAPTVPDPAPALRADTLVVLDALASPARHLDLAAWQTALATLEKDWFAPAAQALDKGLLRRLYLIAPGERAGFILSISSSSRWCFWRRPLSLDELHTQLGSSLPSR